MIELSHVEKLREVREFKEVKGQMFYVLRKKTIVLTP